MLTRREAVKGLGAAMAGILIPQDYQMPEDMKGKRKKVRPEDIRSGTLYGQYQLRGSILTIKDASTTASGFMAFGTDMTTIPTSATTGTGIYIDYSGIYGLASDVQQAYMRASDGKIIAGAGDVTLDTFGVTLIEGTSTTNKVKWVKSGTSIKTGEIYSLISGGATGVTVVGGYGTYYGNSGKVEIVASSLLSSENAIIDLIASYGDSSDIRIYNTSGTFSGLSLSTVGAVAPLSLLHLKSTAPTFRMEDSTASAKSLLVTVDANTATFAEVTGGTIFSLDLANLDVDVAGALTISGAEAFGYVAGAGGTVTQNTDKSTGVTLNKPCGTITMSNATLNADTTVSFTLTNSTITTNDVLVLNHLSAGTAGAYLLNAQCASGSASINVRNITAGNLGEAIVISFAVVRVATA